MDLLSRFFDVNNILFTVLGYPISYLEFIGTLFNLACVILIAQRRILNWPVGLIGVILFGALFYQIQLYADVLEQVYYFMTGIIGWYVWIQARKGPSQPDKVAVTINSPKENVVLIIVLVLASIIFTWVLSHIHVWLPHYFPLPASLPALDATTTTMSFAAQYLMIKRRLDNWYLWILVDVIAIGLYWYKEVPFVSLLYVLFLINACYGLWSWRRSLKPTVIG